MKKKLKRISGLLRNLKIEIIMLISAFVIYFLQTSFFNSICIDEFLLKYLVQDRLNGIATFFAITIGVYVTIITVLATSELGISKEMLKKRLDSSLIDIVIIGILEDLCSIIFAMFIPLNAITRYLLFIFLVVAITSFIKFIFILIYIFKGNMEHMAKIMDDEDQYRENIITFLYEISRYCRENNKM